MPGMRTTLTIDEDPIRALPDLAHRCGIGFSTLLNATPRRAPVAGNQPATTPEPFRLMSAPRGLRPGIDPMPLNQLADMPETEPFIAAHQRVAAVSATGDCDGGTIGGNGSDPSGGG
jgi:hypothetical protein